MEWLIAIALEVVQEYELKHAQTAMTKKRKEKLQLSFQKRINYALKDCQFIHEIPLDAINIIQNKINESYIFSPKVNLGNIS